MPDFLSKNIVCSVNAPQSASFKEVIGVAKKKQAVKIQLDAPKFVLISIWK